MTAQNVPFTTGGTMTLTAELHSISFDPHEYSDMGHYTLDYGQVNGHDFRGLTPGSAVAAYIDNAMGLFKPDTVMRQLNESGAMVAFNDDGSPMGNGHASGMISTVSSDGVLRLQVTGYDDYDFDGIDDSVLSPHAEKGDYALFIKTGPFGDVDCFRLTNLAPGTHWRAETTLDRGSDSELDTVLTEYDSSGLIVQANDDIDADNPLSVLESSVPTSGQIVIAVSAFPDQTNVGAHLASGAYRLAVRFALPGDANSDGRVDLADFGTLKTRFGIGTTWREGDFSGDGNVNVADFGIFKEHFGESNLASVAAEPRSIVLLLAGCAVCVLALLCHGALKTGQHGTFENRP